MNYSFMQLLGSNSQSQKFNSRRLRHNERVTGRKIRSKKAVIRKRPRRIKLSAESAVHHGGIGGVETNESQVGISPPQNKML